MLVKSSSITVPVSSSVISITSRYSFRSPQTKNLSPLGREVLLTRFHPTSTTDWETNGFAKIHVFLKSAVLFRLITETSVTPYSVSMAFPEPSSQVVFLEVGAGGTCSQRPLLPEALPSSTRPGHRFCYKEWAVLDSNQ